MGCCPPIMGCCPPLSEEEKEAIREHKRIEKQLKKDRTKCSKVIKLLLLGTGESGKTTFIKQMRLSYTGGFNDQEKKDFIKIIHQNMFTSMKAMIKGMDLLKINYDNPEIMLIYSCRLWNSKYWIGSYSQYSVLYSFHDKWIERKESTALHWISTASSIIDMIKYYDSVQLVNVDTSAFDEFNVNAFKKLWAFEGIQESYRQRRLYQLTDSTDYFFSNIDRVTAENYLPTNDDILRARVETKGVQEYDFRVEKYIMKITDIAGQRSQRNKWFELFEKCNTMIFLSAISEYDQMLTEDEKVNRLQESIKLFKGIINHCIFKNKPNILFLNKIDLLEQKLADSHFVDYFPEYEGQPRDAMATKLFIEKMFVDQKEDPGGVIYPYFTCATDTENIKCVFKAAKSAIIENNLKNILV